MDEGNGYSDNKIADDAQIEMMNRAYTELLPTHTKRQLCTFMSGIKHTNTSICMPDYGIIEEVYIDELRMIHGLRYLSQYARLMSTKTRISCVIDMKNRVVATLRHLLTRGDRAVPTIDNERGNKAGYSALYLELESIEVDILSRLTQTRGLTYLLMHECAVAYAFATLRP